MPHKPQFVPSQFPSANASGWFETSVDVAKAYVTVVLRSVAESMKGNTLNSPPPVSLIDIVYRENFQVGVVWEIKKDTAGWAEREEKNWTTALRTETLRKGERLVQIRTEKDEKKNRFVLGQSESLDLNVWFRENEARTVNSHPQWGIRGDLTVSFRRDDGGIPKNVVKPFKALTVWERWKKEKPGRWTRGMMTLGPGVFAGYVKAMGKHSDDEERRKFPSIWVIWQWDDTAGKWVEGVYRVKNPDSKKRSTGVFLHPGHTPSHFLGCLSPGRTEREWGFKNREETQQAMWEILNDVGVKFTDFKANPSQKEAKWFLIRVADPAGATQLPAGVIPAKVAVDAVVMNGNLEVCSPVSFQAYCSGPVTDDDRKKVKWEVREKASGKDLCAEPEVKPKGAQLDIECVPFGWRRQEIEVSAYIPRKDGKKPRTPPQFTARVAAPVGSVIEYIELVEIAEQAYPTTSGEDLLNSLRFVAGYDNQRFLDFYGGIAKAKDLTPNGLLTQAMIDRMKQLTRHSGGQGIAKDSLGIDVGLGHVLTGISAGQHPHKRDLLGPAGEPMDNLYAVTISGDLGQSAVEVQKGSITAYIGPGSEADYAELVGDLDGWLIGKNLNQLSGGRMMTGAKLSEVLLAYYCTCKKSDVTMRTRFQRFQADGLSKLKEEVWAFATTYKYVAGGPGVTGWIKGKVTGAVGSLESHPDNAYSGFEKWLDAEVVKEKAR